MKRFLLGPVLTVALTSCYKGNYTFPVVITGNQQTYKVSYLDNKGIWRDTVIVPNGFTIYNEYNDDWKLDLIVIGDSVHVSVFNRNVLIKEFSGRDTLELHETIKY
ncbi:hypothetical protein [Tenuifilum osseticum]|uniref:hypothetical protein n=1 Tax=Tenuifilum osseticum TaxID=3374723 RepID=UPI0034E5B303